MECTSALSERGNSIAELLKRLCAALLLACDAAAVHRLESFPFPATQAAYNALSTLAEIEALAPGDQISTALGVRPCRPSGMHTCDWHCRLIASRCSPHGGLAGGACAAFLSHLRSKLNLRSTPVASPIFVLLKVQDTPRAKRNTKNSEINTR